MSQVPKVLDYDIQTNGVTKACGKRTKEGRIVAYNRAILMRITVFCFVHYDDKSIYGKTQQD